MCIFSVTGEKVAESDIVCYKQMRCLRGVVVSPLIGRFVSKRVLMGKRLYRARGIECVNVKGLDGGAFVDGGFVYSYVRKCNVVDNWMDFIGYECVIPAGTRYWESYDGEIYASKSLRFVKRIR